VQVTSKTGLKAEAKDDVEFANVEYRMLLKFGHPFDIRHFYIRYFSIFLSKITAMPSFDLVSKVDLQTLDNAINTVSKEITNRFDFKGSHVVIDLNKKDFKVNLEADSDMKIQQIIDVLISRSMKQGLAAEVYDLSKEPYPSGKVTKKEVPVRNGIKQEDAKKIVKIIKDSGLKVQVAIMDDIIRVTGKKIDDLQEVIQASKSWNVGIALQYINMKS
jgi:uncharacterized protein YajQ (UPF0234 family)